MLQRVEGFLSASVEEVYRLARSLCAEGDNAEQRFAASWGLWLQAHHSAWMGSVDWVLLGSLVIGSLPGIFFGSHLSARVPDKVLRPVLATILVIVGVRMLRA